MTGDMEGRVILDVMEDDVLPKGRYPKNFHVDVLFRSMSLIGCQEGGRTWMTLRVPVQRHGRQGHP